MLQKVWQHNALAYLLVSAHFSASRPYTLPLKYVEWVKHELNILEAAGIIVHSVSPWASPLVVVPKRSAPDEPPK